MTNFGLCINAVDGTISIMTKKHPSKYHQYPVSEGDHTSSSLPEPSSTNDRKAATSLSRYVLPKELDAAIKQLNDQELDRLVSAALEERSRRKKLSLPDNQEQ